MLNALAAGLSLVFALMLAWLLEGSRRLARPRGPAPGGRPRPRISVVVPLRNEERNARTTLQALADQNYDGWWEVICVDDRSADRTAEIIAEFCRANPRFSHVAVDPREPQAISPKKRALARGFERARGEVFMTTDADCLPPPNWISSMAACFTPGMGIVQGPKRIEAGAGGVLSRFQETEVFGLVSIEAASFAMGRPMIASAPSLAYRRELYETVGGFSTLEGCISGDDDLLVHKMMTLPGVRVAYNLDPGACVVTSPVRSWRELLLQRARWASNGARYEQKGFVCLLFCIYAFYWWLFASPLLALAGRIPWRASLGPLALKIGLNALFLRRTSGLLRQGEAFRNVWWCELLHIPIVLCAVILGHFGFYRWK